MLFVLPRKKLCPWSRKMLWYFACLPVLSDIEPFGLYVDERLAAVRMETLSRSCKRIPLYKLTSGLSTLSRATGEDSRPSHTQGALLANHETSKFFVLLSCLLSSLLCCLLPTGGTAGTVSYRRIPPHRIFLDQAPDPTS